MVEQKVTPFTGVGIEIPLLIAMKTFLFVTPFTGVGIEIKIDRPILAEGSCHPLHGGGN